MFKPFHFLITIFLLSISIFNNAIAKDKIEKQREIYQKINELLVTSKTENTLDIARRLREKLVDYPLISYVDWQLFSAQLHDKSFADLQDFLIKNKTLPMIKNLPDQWFIANQNTQNESNLQEIYKAKALAKTIVGRCAVLTAELQLGNLLNIQDNNQQQKLSLIEQRNQQTEALWLTGASLPKNCDDLILAYPWSQEQFIARSLLAFENNNIGLLTHLRNQAEMRFGNIPTVERINEWLNFRKNPQQLPQFLENLTALDIEVQQRLILSIMPAYIRSLEEETNKDLREQIQGIIDLAKQFQLTESQQQQWLKDYASRMFDNQHTAFQQWRDAQLQQWKDDKLTERRIRLALRQEQDYLPWLALLSKTKQQDVEWQYWQAQSLLAQEKKIEAENLLKSLAKKRGFFAILAAADLNIPYELDLDDSLVNKTKKSKTDKNDTALLKPFKPTLARIHELKALNDMEKANVEWRNLMELATTEEKILLGNYAASQQWWDWQVDASIAAKDWNNLILRLPLAYLDWFELFTDDKLENSLISTSFALAIARQESAFKAKVTSSANARGLMQLLPSTAKLTAEQMKLPYKNENQLFDPFFNIMLGTAHLNQLAEKYHGNRVLIAAAYNAGSHRVDQWLNRANGKFNLGRFVSTIPFFETRGYVQNVIAYDTYYQRLQGKAPILFAIQEYHSMY